MQSAINEALKCKMDVPVGCVIKKDGKIVSCAYNQREVDNDVTAHAELLAIKEAQKILNTSRLNECELYVTLEPCAMCAGAIINSRIRKVYIGTDDEKTGACGSVLNLFEYKFNHKVEVEKGILKQECKEILQKFFKELRLKRKEK
mgnify:CR=1 FL=1